MNFFYGKFLDMVKYDLHFFSVDTVPLIIQFLKERGIKIDSHRSVPFNEVRATESHCPENCVILKSKYHV